MQEKIIKRLSEIYINEPAETHRYAAEEMVKTLTVVLAESIMEDIIEKKSYQEGIKEASQTHEGISKDEAIRQQVRGMRENR